MITHRVNDGTVFGDRQEATAYARELADRYGLASVTVYAQNLTDVWWYGGHAMVEKFADFNFSDLHPQKIDQLEFQRRPKPLD